MADHDHDQLGPARGIFYGAAICLPIWAAVAAAAFGYWVVAAVAVAVAAGVILAAWR